MLQQLRRLSSPVPPAGPNASAIAVYADAADHHVPASDMGFEGIACVDDAARAVVLFIDLWEATRVPAMRAWAASLVDFLLYMQLPDGRFVNFIWDWNGPRNLDGPTSYPGGGFWQARGVRGLAKAAVVLGDERARRGMDMGLGHIRSAVDVPSDVRAIHAIMLMELIRAGGMTHLRGELERWADEIAAVRRGAVLLDNPDAASPHLWGHVQEGVLADAGALLGRADLVAVARQSALEYLAPLVESGFDLPTVQPYGVASVVYSLERLAAVTGDPVFAELLKAARAWFDGRNPAHRPVYDRDAGRVHDGIDDGLLNRHSGAESNIVGAQALIDDVIARGREALATAASTA